MSGSGESTLVNNDILCTSLGKQIYNARTVPGRHRRIGDWSRWITLSTSGRS